MKTGERVKSSFFHCGTIFGVDNSLSQVIFLCIVRYLAASFCSTYNMPIALLPMSHFWQSKLTLVRTQLCPTLCNPMYCSPPGSSVYGIFQARILECVAIFSSRECSWFRDLTHVSCTGRQILYCWDTREGPQTDSRLCKHLLRGGQLGDSHSSLRTTRWCRTKESHIFSGRDQQ